MKLMLSFSHSLEKGEVRVLALVLITLQAIQM